MWNQSYGLIIILYDNNIVEKGCICGMRRKYIILTGYLLNQEETECLEIKDLFFGLGNLTSLLQYEM